MFSLNRLMGMPENASEHGYTIDHMLEFCHWFMLALAVGWSIFFVYTLWRFRAGRSPKADYYGVRTKASTHIEFMVVLIDVLLLIGFAVPLWAKRVMHFPLGDAITVKVVGAAVPVEFSLPRAGRRLRQAGPLADIDQQPVRARSRRIPTARTTLFR